MTNKQQAQGSLLQTLRPVVVLVSICLCMGALLGAVHAVTAPVAAANAQEKAQKTYAMLMPEARTFEDVTAAHEGVLQIEGVTAVLEAQNDAGELLGYVVVAQSKGYGGQVPLAVAFSTDGAVQAITAMANEETPGLGTKIADDSYLGQYVGLEAGPLTADDVDLISGATISSKAALSAFNRAVEAYEEVR